VERVLSPHDQCDLYYNTTLLSRVYEQKKAAQDQAAMAAIQGIFPVAWQRINLIG
jgi:hypothetical protein